MEISFDSQTAVKGVGVDATTISRFRKMDPDIRERLARRVLAPCEYEVYASSKDPEKRLACFWAEKESVSKALGTGFRGIAYSDIIIKKNALGKPCVYLTEKGAGIAGKSGITSISIALTHELDTVICVSVAS